MDIEGDHWALPFPGEGFSVNGWGVDISSVVKPFSHTPVSKLKSSHWINNNKTDGGIGGASLEEEGGK